MPKRSATSSLAKATGSKSAKSATDEIAPCVSNEEETMTPHDAYFKRLFAAKDKIPNVLGPTIIRGIPRDDDDDEEEEEDSDAEENEDTSKYTAEQMQTLRYIMITQNRQDKIYEMAELVLGDRAGDCIMGFNTSFSYEVEGAFHHLKSQLWARAKGPTAKFDLLLAFTQTVKRYDVWMHDNEGGMEEWVKDFGSMWKRLLKNTDEKLGIDAEYTRPGVVCLLEQFKEQVETALNGYTDPPLNFKFQ